MTSTPDIRLEGGFEGRVALVAGASRGIGAVTARAFAAAGAAVVIGARDEAALDAVAAQIRDEGGKAVPVRTDVGEPESCAHLVQVATDEFGRLDVAFNNATDGPPPQLLADLEPHEFDRSIRANVRGTFLGMKYQIPAMLQGGGGAIVNMASVAGLTGFTGLAGYVAGKAGIIGLTKVAALDYADQGVRVNVVAPGPILTHHLERAGAEAQRQTARAVPMRRIGQSEEVANAVLWLCSPQSSYITGTVLPIDGGQSAGGKPERTYRPGRPMQPEPDAPEG